MSAASANQKFSLVVWNAYAGTTAPPATPAILTATAVSPSAVALSWPSVGALLYQIQRSTGVYDPYVTVAETSGASFTDSGRAAMTTYLYRVRAVNATQVSDWVVDSATTAVFSDPFLTGAVIRATHLNELRSMVTAMRVAAGVSSVIWTDHPSAVAGVTTLRSAHLTELRSALTDARTALGLPGLTFTDGTLTPGVSVVKAVHIQELRGGVQ